MIFIYESEQSQFDDKIKLLREKLFTVHMHE